MWLVAEFVPNGGPKAMWVFASEDDARARYVGRGMQRDCESIVFAGPFRPGDDILNFLDKMIEHHEKPSPRRGMEL